MILEGIVTTVAPTGEVNVAPMGPRVDADMKRLELRPFRTAQTYWNLCKHGEGVFHVTDDVLLLAHTAVGGRQATAEELMPATTVRGQILRGACRYYEFRVGRIDDRDERVSIDAEVVASGQLRDFFGFNRAKHAVVEAAILATRVHLLPRKDIEAEFRRLAVLVQKTGGAQEHEAFRYLEDYVRDTQAAGSQQ
jgi:uncharacterized protein